MLNLSAPVEVGFGAAAPPMPRDPDPSSLAELFHERYDQMVRVAFLLTGSQAVAEDIVQDAFAQMHRRFDRIETSVAYLRTSVVNGTKKHHRSKAREAARLALMAPDASVDPEARLLVDAIAKLPHPQRVAIVLRYYGGESTRRSPTPSVANSQPCAHTCTAGSPRFGR